MNQIEQSKDVVSTAITMSRNVCIGNFLPAHVLDPATHRRVELTETSAATRRICEKLRILIKVALLNVGLNLMSAEIG